MTENQEKQKAELRERFKKEEARFRHLGYFLFFGLAVVVFIPLGVGVVTGIVRGQAWDPFTGEEAFDERRELDCRREATDLIFIAGGEDRLHNSWEQRYRRWVVRCQDPHLDYYEHLTLARDRLRGAATSPTLDSEPETP